MLLVAMWKAMSSLTTLIANNHLSLSYMLKYDHDIDIT